MDAEVGGERQAAGELQAPDLADRPAPADDRQRALVEVAERARWLPARRARSPWPRGRLLDRDRREARAAACRRAPGCDAMSPITEISGWPGTVRSGSTSMRPPRSVLRAGGLRRALRSAAPRAPRRPRSPSGWRSARSCRPPRSSRRARRSPWPARPRARSRRARPARSAALAESDSLNGASTRSPASSRITRESSGSMRAKSRFRESWRATASAPAISTPVGPPPIDAKVSHSLARVRVRRPARPPRTRRRCGSRRSTASASVFSPHDDVLPLVLAEVGRLRAARDDQAVVADPLAAVEHDLPPLGVDVRHLGHQHVDVGCCALSAAADRRRRNRPSTRRRPPPGRAAAGRGDGSCGR